MAALGVVPASRVAMDTSSLLIAFGPPLTFKAPAPKLIISDEFNSLYLTLCNTRITLRRRTLGHKINSNQCEAVQSDATVNQRRHSK